MKKTIAIIGGGASALMLAATINPDHYNVTIYERNNAVGRKLLVAGAGGFNLTHSEDIERLITRYTPAFFLEKSIRSFTNTDLRNWLNTIGIETYIGTSKRVFPVKEIKPIDVLTAILKQLKQKNVVIKTQYTWKGWSDNEELIFENDSQIINIKADVTVFAMGGASWQVTGSDGSWLNYFEEKGIKTIPFQPSNCAVKINWNKEFIKAVEGKSLKNILIKCGDKERKGEVVITKFGLEGGAIYALIGEIRKQLNIIGTATIYIDLKPLLSIEEIKTKLLNRGNKSVTKQLEEVLNLNETPIALLKSILSKEEFTSTEMLSNKIKKLPITIAKLAPIDEAISTVGGIALTEVNQNFELKELPLNYCIGEMLDWDAPTGGYLLQACFSIGNYLGELLNRIST